MKMSRILAGAVVLLLVLTVLPLVTGAGASGESGEIVSVASRDFVVRGLARKGLDLLAQKDGRVYIVLAPGDLAVLNAAGVPFVDETERFFAIRQSETAVAGDINGAYHSYPELETALRTMASAHPDLATLHEAGVSLENRKIYALQIGSNITMSPVAKPGLLLVGCHHAREWISVEVPLLFGQYLLDNYALNAAVKSLVDGSDIWIVPMVNPDGLEYTIHTYRYWRKNRRANPDGSFGVDINRNYTYEWGYDNVGSSSTPAADDYRGPAPLSEPETQAVRRLFLSYNFRAVISFHSFGQEILYPWGYADIPAPTDAALQSLAQQMAVLIAGVHGSVYTFGRGGAILYVTNGELTDYTYSVSGIPSYTIELPPVDVLHGGFFNSEADINAVFSENLPAILFLAGYAAGVSLPPPMLRPRPALPDRRIDRPRELKLAR